MFFLPICVALLQGNYICTISLSQFTMFEKINSKTMSMKCFDMVGNPIVGTSNSTKNLGLWIVSNRLVPVSNGVSHIQPFQITIH